MIDELERLTARRGQRIKPRLKEFLFWLTRQKLESGRGILLRRTSEGTVVSANVPSPVFIGAFHVSQATDNSFFVGRGFVNGIEPTINGVRISGEERRERPEVRLPKKFDKQNRAFIWIEITVGKDGRIDPEKAESCIVGADDKRTGGDRLKGRHVIAMLKKNGEAGPVQIFQVAFFNYRHAYKEGRHFFVPA